MCALSYVNRARIGRTIALPQSLRPTIPSVKPRAARGRIAALRGENMRTKSGSAFGAPGIAPTWCSSDKDFVTTALGASRLWATVGHGIVNEVYWPSTGTPQIRDLGFYLVGAGRWIDLKRESRYRLLTPGPGL